MAEKLLWRFGVWTELAVPPLALVLVLNQWCASTGGATPEANCGPWTSAAACTIGALRPTGAFRCRGPSSTSMRESLPALRPGSTFPCWSCLSNAASTFFSRRLIATRTSSWKSSTLAFSQLRWLSAIMASDNLIFLARMKLSFSRVLICVFKPSISFFKAASSELSGSLRGFLLKSVGHAGLSARLRFLGRLVVVSMDGGMYVGRDCCGVLGLSGGDCGFCTCANFNGVILTPRSSDPDLESL